MAFHFLNFVLVISVGVICMGVCQGQKTILFSKYSFHLYMGSGTQTMCQSFLVSTFSCFPISPGPRVCSFKRKKKSSHTVQRPKGTQWESSCLQFPLDTDPFRNLVMNLKFPGLWKKNKFLLLNSPQSRVLCYGSLRRLIQQKKKLPHNEVRKGVMWFHVSSQWRCLKPLC